MNRVSFLNSFFCCHMTERRAGFVGSCFDGATYCTVSSIWDHMPTCQLICVLLFDVLLWLYSMFHDKTVVTYTRVWGINVCKSQPARVSVALRLQYPVWWSHYSTFHVNQVISDTSSLYQHLHFCLFYVDEKVFIMTAISISMNIMHKKSLFDTKLLIKLTFKKTKETSLYRSIFVLNIHIL